MLQELFQLHLFGREIPIYGYGLMLVIGFLSSIELAKFLARRSGIHPDIFVNAGLLALVAGIVGARVSHVLENLGAYTDPSRTFAQNFWDAINLSSGGLTYYGGFILAFPALVLYGLYKKVPIRRGMDIIAPCLMLGLGFGRIGCFLNGCCFGSACTLPWQVQFPYNSFAYQQQFDEGSLKTAPPMELVIQTETGPKLLSKAQVSGNPHLAALAATQLSNPVHPVQLYSTLTAWLIAAFLLALYTLPHPPGQIFAVMLILEGLTRFLLELLRVEPPVLGPMSFSMVTGLTMVAVGLILLASLATSSYKHPTITVHSR